MDFKKTYDLIRRKVTNNTVNEFGNSMKVTVKFWARGGVVVKALRYKPAGRGVDSRRCHWNFSMA
jgi:hypothetical protein